MKRKKSDLNISEQTPAHVFLVSVLLCGILAGNIIALQFKGNENFDYFYDYIMLNLTQMTVIERLLFSLFNNLKYIFVILLVYFTPFNFFLIPLVLAFKGFFISFSVAFLIYTFETQGFIISFLSTGINSIFSIPAIVMLSIILLCFSTNRSFNSFLGREYKIVNAIIMLTLVSVLYDTFLSPMLLNLILS